MAWRATVGAAFALLALTACRPTERGAMAGRGGGMMGGGGMRSGMMGGGDTAAAPRPTPAVAAPAAGCPPVTGDLVAAGRAVFAGPGHCQSCHGAHAQGTALAPDLTDGQWLDIDGSYGAIAQLVRTGVPRPKQHPAPMPALGGARLDPGQVCAVAAYVLSLAHGVR